MSKLNVQQHQFLVNDEIIEPKYFSESYESSIRVIGKNFNKNAGNGMATSNIGSCSPLKRRSIKREYL